MAVKFQYNKTSLQNLKKQLKIRVRALPTLKNKEAALRVEVKKAKSAVKDLKAKYEKKKEEYSKKLGIWNEFDTRLLSIKEVKTSGKKIAGVNTPVFEEVVFDEKDFSLDNNPAWFPQGIAILKELAAVAVEKDIFIKKMEMLNYARRKTTQKVNLYEKVQIPDYEDAIRKIKRFLEDEENLSKSAQKIVKKRQSTIE